MIDISKDISSFFPIGTTVIFLHAHPDDESFLSAGLIQELNNLKRNCIMIYTAAALVKGQQKTYTRQHEAKNACEVLGINNIHYLKYCEPKYLDDDAVRFFEQDPCDISNEIDKKLKEINIESPLIFVSYDKNGGYGNKDHKLLHKAGRYFLSNNKQKISAYFEITINRDLVNNWLSSLEKGASPYSIPKLSYWSKEFGLEEREISFLYKLSDTQLKNKRTALSIHESQVNSAEFPLSLSDKDFAQVFDQEFIKKVF